MNNLEFLMILKMLTSISELDCFLIHRLEDGKQNNS